jgi:hypothetical protein
LKKNQKANTKVLPIAVFLVSLSVAILCLLQSLDKPLSGPHAFRQTQTTISSYNRATVGAPCWQNILPVLGEPWNLLVEFPFFQYAIGRFWIFFGGDLVFLGRFIYSLLWVLSTIPLFSKTRITKAIFPYGIINISISAALLVLFGFLLPSSFVNF